MENKPSVPAGLELTGKSVKKYRGTDRVLVIPDGVEQVESYAFSGCEALEEITLPATVRCIGQLAFKNCTSLRLVKLGFCELIDIGWSVFFGCKSGIKIIFAGDSETLEKSFGPRYEPPEYEFMYGERCEGRWHYPLGHAEAEQFTAEAYCEADGVTVTLTGRRVHFLGWE